MVEIAFKVVATLIFLFFTWWIWTHQIDVKGTILGPVRKKVDKPVEWIATRDPNVIYQSDSIVGNVTGTVTEIDGKVLFKELSNTGSFNHNMPFEYKRERLKVINIGFMAGMYASATNRGTEIKQGVLKDVVCERIK